jgi:threonine aldolase
VLQSHYFYIWDEKTLELRWMTSFDTTEADIQAFLAALATHVPAAL